MVNVLLLRSKIVEKGYTQNGFADAVNMSPQKLSSKMTGRIRFSLDEIMKIARELGLDINTTWSIFFEN